MGWRLDGEFVVSAGLGGAVGCEVKEWRCSVGGWGLDFYGPANQVKQL